MRHLTKLLFFFAVLFSTHLLATPQPYIYVLCTQSVAIVDPITKLYVTSVTIPGPGTTTAYAMDITPDGQFIYVPDTAGNLYVISTNSRSIVKTISIPAPYNTLPPVRVAITPNGRQLYLTVSSSAANGAVIIVDVASNTVTKTLALNGAANMVLTPNGQKLYVTTSQGSPFLIQVVNTVTNTFGTSITGIDSNTSATNPIIMSADGSTAYVTNSTVLSAINTTSDALAFSVALGGVGGRGLCVTPDGSKVYVGCVNTAQVYLVNTLTQTSQIIPITAVGGSIPQPGYFMTISPDGGQVFTGFFNQPNIASIRPNLTPTVANAINIFSNPALVPPITLTTFNKAVVSPDSKTGYLLTTTGATGGISVFDIASQQSVGPTIRVGPQPPLTSDTLQISIIYAAVPSSFSSSVSGFQSKNNFGLQIDLVNTVNWSSLSSFTPSPVRYEIYRDAAFTQLAGTVAGNVLQFVDHDRAKGKSYSYYIVPVFSNGVSTLLGYTTVNP